MNNNHEPTTTTTTTPTPTPPSTFDLDHAKANNPILHVIPYTSSFTLYRFPPTSPDAPKLLAHALSQPIPPSSSSSASEPETNPEVSLKHGGQGFLTVTKTKEEISIMVDSELEVNRGLLALAEKEEGVIVDGPFGCLRVRGPMDLNLVGIASRLLIPLTKASISVFIISSYDTDFIFLARDELERAGRVLREDGWVVL